MSLRARTGANGSSTTCLLHPHWLFTGPNLFRRKAHSASPRGPAWNWLINCVSFIYGGIHLMYLWVLMCECWRLRIKNYFHNPLDAFKTCAGAVFCILSSLFFQRLIYKNKKNVFRSELMHGKITSTLPARKLFRSHFSQAGLCLPHAGFPELWDCGFVD